MTSNSADLSVRQWLSFGWRCFNQSKIISIAFSSIFFIAGGLLYWLLLNIDAAFVIFPFIAGFFIVAPLLIIGFQQAAAMIQKKQQPKFSDLIRIKGQYNKSIWFLVFILCLCYFIWITDALVIYGLYFGIEPIPLDASLFADTELRLALATYLLHSGILGLVLAIIGFLLGVFSIPLIIHQQMDIVPAVNLSVKTVFRHKWLMTKWAVTLVTIMALTLVLALPLLVIILPILGYASYAVYAQIIADEDISNTAQKH